MKENLFKLRVLLWTQLVAGGLIIFAASVVGYAALQTSENLVVEYVPTNNILLPRGEVSLNKLYISATPLSGATSSATYVFDLATNQWESVFEHPYHSSFYPLSADTAIVSMPNIELTPDQLTPENNTLPAFIDLTTGIFNYIETPLGYNEQHYRVSPELNGYLAYMQQNINSAAAEVTTIADWQTIIYRSDLEQSIVIDGAMYPEWIAPGYVSYLRPEGLFGYDLETGQETAVDLPFTDYSIANQYLVSLAVSADPYVLLTASGENQFAILTGQLGETNQLQADIKHVVTEPGTIFFDPVLSPDQLLFAVLALTNVTNTDTGKFEIKAEIRLYNFATANIVQRIAIESYDPESLALLGWQ